MHQVLSLTAQPFDLARMDYNELPRMTDPASPFNPSSLPPFTSFDGNTRRRSESIGVPFTSHDDLDTLRLTASNSLNPGMPRDICICTPEPKIPRPRNAFILYRQHHQSQVTTDNPKMSNPEISKVIGERWKHEDPIVKENWRKMAEQEKQRHQSQYPNYRYQPRRGGKSQSWSGSTPADDQGRCPKCNGRFASSTPRTPSTPFSHQIASTANFQDPQDRPSLHRLNTNVPRRASVDLSPVNRQPFMGPHVPFRSPDSDPTSPAPKRRRANGMEDYRLDSGRRESYGGMPFEGSLRGPMHRPSYYQGGSWIELGSRPVSRNLPMFPPPRPSNPCTRNEYDSRGNNQQTFDESLRLPPLKEATSPSSWLLPLIDEDRRRNTPAREVISPTESNKNNNNFKDMKSEIMAISAVEKTKTLEAICQPVQPSLLEAPLNPTRGAIIAIEGPDAKILREAGLEIERELMSYDGIRLKVWEGSSVSASMLHPGGVSESADDLAACFQAVMPSRDLSKQLVQYITNKEAGQTSATQPSENDATNKGKARADNIYGAEMIPIALIGDGLSLTLSDRLASTTPSTDHFSPSDHWRWMAGLCRGIVAPDLVIYVEPCEEHEVGVYGKLDVPRPGLITVGVPIGKELDQGTKRRLIFEVVEWIRGSGGNRSVLGERRTA